MPIQAWDYHQQAPKAGRKLLLLEKDELIFALPLIYRVIHPDNKLSKPLWFTQITSVEHDVYRDLVTALNLLVSLRKKTQALEPQLLTVNRLLNQYFSDLGWRMVRKELSQIKKRQKKSHIELSNDIITKLKVFIQQEKLDSFDQAIDTLLSDRAVDSFDNLDT